MSNAIMMEEVMESQSLKKILFYELYRVSKQDKEDVKQNCLVEIMKTLSKYEREIPKKELPTLCQRIIKNTVADYFRKINRKIEKNTINVVFQDTGEDDSHQHESDYDNVFDEGLVVDQYQEKDNTQDWCDITNDYENNISNFTPNEKKVVEYILYKDDGKGASKTEIAQELGVNKSSASRAISKLSEVCAS